MVRLIILIFAIISKLLRISFNSANSLGGRILVNRIKEGRVDPEKYSEQLEFLVKAKPMDSNKDFEKIFSLIPERLVHGKYQLLFNTPINKDQHLFITEYKDDNNENGPAIHQYNFVLKKNFERQQYQLFSDMTQSNEEKWQKMDFCDIVFKMI